MHRFLRMLSLALVAACGGSAAPVAKPLVEPPRAERGDHVETYHGQPVPDPYRWLEADSARARAWVDAHDRRARAALARLPGRAAFERAILTAATGRRPLAPSVAGERRFFLEADAAITAPSIYVEDGGGERLIVAGDELARDGLRVHTELWPSPTGELLAYGVTPAGSRRMTLRVLDVARGAPLPVAMPGLVATRSSVSWLDGGRALAYTRYDEADGPASAALAHLRLVVRPLAPGAVETTLLESPAPGASLFHWTRDGGDLVVAETDADGRSRLVLLRDALDARSSTELAAWAPGSYWYAGDLGGRLVFATTVGAERGHVRSVDPASATWATLVAEASEPIDLWSRRSAVVVSDRVAVVYRGQPGWRVRIYDDRGAARAERAMPAARSMWSGLVADDERHEVLLSLTGFTDPGTVYRLGLDGRALTAWRRAELPYDPDAYVTEVVQYTRPGLDPAPMFVARRRDLAPDRARAVVVYGYGWGGWSAAPWFRAHLAALLDAGVVFALPALRGGGERGERWHAAGVRRERQNAIDDYLAACEWLAASAWSRAGRIVAEGQSAGGSLVAMAVLQRPRLFAAQILAFPVLDMLRYERFAGAASWRAEFGTVADPDDFAVLRATSPVHNVATGACYPPALLLPGDRDEVTPALHAYKYAAALQHASACASPVWLRVARGTGHAYGHDPASTAASLAAQTAFILHATESRREPARGRPRAP